MTDPQSWLALTYNGLAELLTSAAIDTWDAPSLCEKWRVRHVVAHVTMPVRLTPEQYGAEMAAAGGDFTVLSDAVATRDAALPVADLLDQLRSPKLHAWQPPGGGDRRPRPAHRRQRDLVWDRPHRCPGRGRRHHLDLGRRPARSR